MTSAVNRLRLAGLALLLSTAATGVAQAQVAGVETLLQQAKYWRSKGREDLAQQALRRAKALDPNSAAVAKAITAPPPRAKPAPKAKTSKVAVASTRSEPASPRSKASNRAGKARVAGFAALDDSKLGTAERQFRKALSVNRRDPDALGGLGLVRLRQGQFAEAADLLGQASRFGKASQWAEGLASARFFAGIDNARTLLDQGRVGEAQAEAEKLVRSGYPEPAPALELLANVYEKQGRYADAAELYRQASQGGKQDEKRLQLRAIRGRALAAAARGDELQATREFQSGLLLDSQDPWIRYEFAQFLLKNGRISDAESLIRSLTNIGSGDALYAAALIDSKLGRTAEAERLIDMIPKAQRTAPIRNFAIGVKVDSAIDRAQAMSKAGRTGEALAALRQLGAIDNLPVGKQAAIANALFDLGDAPGAAMTAERAMQGEVSSLGDYEGLIGILVRIGRDDLAQNVLQRAGSRAGGSAEDQQAYGRMKAALLVSQADRARSAGRYAESFDILQSAWSVAPDNNDVLLSLARLYQSGNMASRAAQTYQLVLTREPDNRDALLGLAASAQAAGNNDLSEKAQAKVLSTSPQDYEVNLALANVERARGDERAAVKLLKRAREIYSRQQGYAGIQGKNPFAAMTPAGDANPFRHQAAAHPQVNPFALGGGTRLPSAPTAAAYSGLPGEMGSPAGYPAAYGSSPGYIGTTSTGPAAMPSSLAGAPLPGASTGYPAPYSGDPVLAQIQSDIEDLSQEAGPRVDVDTSYRQRSGEEGLSQLDEIKGSAQISTGALRGRIYAKAEAVVIDAGKPTGSGLARFGRNGTPEAQAIVDEVESVLVDAVSQHNSGAALSAGYTSESVQLEAGTTPIGMGKTKATFRAAVTPRLNENMQASAWVERKPVTDSVVSYAGTRDPVTGERWGQVMRTGGGVGLSYDRDGNGVYGKGRYYRFRGTNVVHNDGFEANVGGYMRAMRSERSTLTVGLNVNYQGYDKSQNYFTFGNGGYFSPQSFISVGFPVNYTLEDDLLDVRASFTPGFQSYSQDESPLYPTDAAAQGQLDSLKALNSDVRSMYDSVSKTGFALSAGGSLYYKISPSTRIGGETSYNTFGNYDEFRGMLGVRQSLGSTGQ